MLQAATLKNSDLVNSYKQPATPVASTHALGHLLVLSCDPSGSGVLLHQCDVSCDFVLILNLKTFLYVKVSVVIFCKKKFMIMLFGEF